MNPDTKITNQAYFCNSMGCDVVCLLMSMMEAGGAQGGVCLVVWYRTQVWSVESMRFHGPNVVICEVITNRKWTPIIGAYLPPSTLEHLLDF